jgi:hypothetical protein
MPTFFCKDMVPLVTYAGRPRQAIEILIVMSVLLLARELIGSVPYRNAYFMALTLATIAVIVWRSGKDLRSIGLGQPVAKVPTSWSRWWRLAGLLPLLGRKSLFVALYCHDWPESLAILVQAGCSPLSSRP